MKSFRILAILTFVLCSAVAEAIQQQPETQKSETIVFINGEKFYVHIVKSGDTVFSIARTYGVSVNDIYTHNRNIGETLRLEQTLKIPVVERQHVKRKKKDFIQHEVLQGETLYAIARKYEISVDAIREDNPSLDPQHINIGTTIWIRKSAMGSVSKSENLDEINEYVDQLNASSDDGYAYYRVKPRDTIYSLSRKFGITEQEFISLNNVSNGLKEGAIVKYPVIKNDTQSEETERSATTTKNNEPIYLNEDGQEPHQATTESPLEGKKWHSQQQDPPESNVTQQKRRRSIFDWFNIFNDEPVSRQESDENVQLKSVPRYEELDITMLLPLNVRGKVNAGFVEFYQGFLLGLEEVKESGRHATLTLYNTQHDSLMVQQIVNEEFFANTDLIIGPVYEDELLPAVDYAHEHQIPIVSPLAEIQSERSSTLFQLSPDKRKKYDKIADILASDMNIYLIYAQDYDKEFEAEILNLLQDKAYKSYTYSYNKKSIFTAKDPGEENITDMTKILRQDKPALFIVLAKGETDVDRILGTLSSARTSGRDRGMKIAQHKVLGTSRWSRFDNIDPSTYFRNNVTLISSYHAKRDSYKVREFDSKYIEAYQTLPTLYAYRGYDTAMIFGMNIGNDLNTILTNETFTPLMTTYRFSQDNPGDIFINQEWVRVDYNPDFTITTK